MKEEGKGISERCRIKGKGGPAYEVKGRGIEKHEMKGKRQHGGGDKPSGVDSAETPRGKGNHVP